MARRLYGFHRPPLHGYTAARLYGRTIVRGVGLVNSKSRFAE
jgi:hypothetical protein